DDAFRRVPKKRVLHYLVTVQIISQQFGVVIRHLFEVWDQPALVDRVTMKAPAELIVNPSTRHLLESGLRDEKQLRVACTLITLEDEVHRARVRKFRATSKAAVVRVESLQHRVDLCIHQR